MRPSSVGRGAPPSRGPRGMDSSGFLLHPRGPTPACGWWVWSTLPTGTAHSPRESGMGQVSDGHSLTGGSNLHLPTLLSAYSLVPTPGLALVGCRWFGGCAPILRIVSGQPDGLPEPSSLMWAAASEGAPISPHLASLVSLLPACPFWGLSVGGHCCSQTCVCRVDA